MLANLSPIQYWFIKHKQQSIYAQNDGFMQFWNKKENETNL